MSDVSLYGFLCGSKNTGKVGRIDYSKKFVV